MSARIVVNLAHGLAESAIDREPEGGTWLSLWQTEEVVVVKLSTPSLQALWLTLSRELGMLPGTPFAPEAAGGTGASCGDECGARPPAPEPAPLRGTQAEAP
jgi:hypothetical protein